MPKLFLYTHMGLGDHILCNSIVRKCAAQFNEVFHPVKHHNYFSVQEMYQDLKNVKLISVLGDDDVHAMIGRIRSKHEPIQVEVLGSGGQGGFDSQKFDQEFYRQAGIPFEERWTGFKVPEDNRISAMEYPDTLFFHEDKSRGMVIDRGHFPMSLKHLCPTDFPRPTSIFFFLPLLRQAKQIHCIDSSFAILIDSLPGIQAERKVIHRYSRPGAEYPSYRNNWEILR